MGISSDGLEQPDLQSGGQRFEPDILHYMVTVSQTVRELVCGTRGRGFEPHQSPFKRNFQNKMILKHDLKTIVKGQADLNCVRSGGIAVYHITVEDGTVYSLDIDLSDRHDVGETATFMSHYDKSVILMRWIRRAIEKEELYPVSK